MNDRRYADRRDAGRVLAVKMRPYRGAGDVVVLGLPRGGVPVADEVAGALGAHLDVLVARKLGLPGQPEVAMGAIAAVSERIERVENRRIVAQLGGSDQLAPAFARVAAAEEKELRRRQREYRRDRPPLELEGRTVILVDDGLATGATMRAAVMAVHAETPERVVVATPIGLSGTCTDMRRVADDVVCAWETDELFSVSQAYLDFTQTTDDEVRRILDRAAQRAREGLV